MKLNRYGYKKNLIDTFLLFLRNINDKNKNLKVRLHFLSALHYRFYVYKYFPLYMIRSIYFSAMKILTSENIAQTKHSSHLEHQLALEKRMFWYFHLIGGVHELSVRCSIGVQVSWTSLTFVRLKKKC